MEKTLSKKQKTVYSAAAILVFLVLVYLGDTLIPMTSQWNMLMTVIKKGAIFALVAVSMNLLNGFTGLFSLGQAGFMLIGAYAYAIFSIPAAQHDAVYQYFNGGLFKFSVPEILMNALGGEGSFGGFLGEYAGIFILIIFAGLLTGGIAYLIGIPTQVRLPCDCNAWICRNPESRIPVERHRTGYKRLEHFERVHNLRNGIVPDYFLGYLHSINRITD